MRDLRELGIEPFSELRPSKDEIALFEAAFGFTLPESYKQFLKDANGGRPEANALIPDDADPDEVEEVNFFYFLGDPDDINSYNLWWTTRNFRSVFGQDYIAIANTSNGDVFLLDLHSHLMGVVLSLHESNYDIVDMAASFERFIGLLFVPQDED